MRRKWHQVHRPISRSHGTPWFQNFRGLIAKEVEVPTVPGTLQPVQTNEELVDVARKTGFPVVLKAVAGGGGKGMRMVAKETDLASAWRDASSEAQNAFGDGRMYPEKFLERPRPSRFKYWPMSTATSFILASANVRSSAATKK